MSEISKNIPASCHSDAAVPRCGEPDPLGLVQEEHALQRELCDLLEQIADGLPNRIPIGQAKVAHAILSGSLARHNALEEQALFPCLRERICTGDPLRAVIERLCAEHAQGDAEVIEIIDILDELASGAPPEKFAGLGYLLRSFFESQRKHIAWEDDVLLPAARGLLTDDDLSRIQSWIMASDHPRCCKASMISIRAARAEGSNVCKTCRSAM